MKKKLLCLPILLFLCFSSLAQEVPVLVKDIVPGTESGFGDFLYKDFKVFVTTKDAFYFYIKEATGISFWRSDGSTQGTFSLVKFPRNTGFEAVINSPETNVRAAAVGSTVYFVGYDEVHGVELWQTDGTASGTRLTKDLVPGSTGSDPSHLSSLEGTLIFITYQLDENGTSHSYLWKSGGTAESTVSVKKLFSYSTFMGDFFTVSSKYAFFSLNDGVHGEELWRTDGTEQGTVLLKDIYAGVRSSNISSAAVLDDKLFFRAENSDYGSEPWISDGSAEGTSLIKDIVAGRSNSSPFNFTKAAGKKFSLLPHPLIVAIRTFIVLMEHLKEQFI